MWSYKSYSENALLLLKFSSLLSTLSQIRQTDCIVMMIKEGSAKIVNFMTPGDVDLTLGQGHLSHYGEYALYHTLSICTILIAIVLRDNGAAFLCHC